MTHESIFRRTESLPSSQVTPPQVHDGLLIRLCEGGWIPDALLRAGIRQFCKTRLVDERAGGEMAVQARQSARRRAWREGPIALAADKANEQHYEVPPAFFEAVLGRHLKYSCALWDEGTDSLDQAEEAMLDLTCERAGLTNGMRILELGCGWGSLTLWMAARFPGSRIVAVSNAAPQRNWIMSRAQKRGMTNVEVITADINHFEPAGQFHRVVSVEMLEHVRNHEALFRRIRQWLKPDGALFVHVFCHRELAYSFEPEGRADWMARHFFSGGMMPSYDLFLSYQKNLRLENRWWLSGEHYRKTSEAWLARLDSAGEPITALLRQHYSENEARRALQRWRMFFMAVSELFGLDGGEQWGIGHYVLRPRV